MYSIHSLFMIINDLNKKVVGRFYKEITIDSDYDDNITYVFPDTEEFIAVLKRKFVNQKITSDVKKKLKSEEQV